ncbi:MAG: D-sedoheptulose 7-phosphate isomerase [Candidatus Omnitrophota bacterium]
MKNKIIARINDSISVKQSLAADQEQLQQIEAAVTAIIKTYKKNGKILIFGNGGSAADSQHFAAEFVGRFLKERRALPAIALTANSSTLTALANDYTYEYVFERQIEAFGQKGDIAIGISTSGGAKNVIAGLKQAKKMGLICIGLTGQKGVNLKEHTDICLFAPSKETPRIQEAHIVIIHIICDLVEEALA